MCPNSGDCDTETLINRIAHALRNPIFAASLQAELAASRASDPAIGKIVKHLDRLEELVEEMLLLGRPAHIKPQDIHPVTLLAEAAASMAGGGTEEAGPDIRVSAGNGPVTAHWDPHAVKLILERLLKNAIENSPPEHPILIELGQPSADQVTMTVADHGKGIDEDLREQIFEPFFPQHQGKPGLGLAVARKFARALGGDIELEPNSGGGTRAIVRLPLRVDSSNS